MDEIFIEEDEEQATGGGWLATFADLMSLLMCFFVLMLSFSEMDVLKYKQVAGSMREAFGVQNEIKVKDIPKGTSIIAQEFSAGRPDPTPLNKVQQATVDFTKQSLDTRSRPPGTSEAKSDLTATPEQVEALMREVLRRQSESAAKILSEALQDEIDAGKIDIESGLSTVTIRIREKGSFPSGSADLSSDFLPVIGRLRRVLKDVDGDIAVEGHTDNIPISNALFRSNWGLSVDRALSVAHELMKEPEMDEERFMVIGYADTRPFASNDNPQDRSQNRRVEIVIKRGLEDAESIDLRALEESNPGLVEELQMSPSNSIASITPTDHRLFVVKND
jgi:chemotaxis protein MotB